MNISPSISSDYLSAALLGLVEGLTEFIPVSSTGHLILFGSYLNFAGGASATFEIFIQLGAILAVLLLYRHRFLGLLKGRGGEGFEGRDGLSKIAAGCLPVFVMGFLFHRAIKEYLFFPYPVALALVAGGIAMIFVDRMKLEPSARTLGQISFKQALAIGLFQCFSLWPGMSRSASTILGGMLSGVSLMAAAEFSFIIAVPVIAVAATYDLLKTYQTITASEWMLFAIGFVVSFLTAIAALRIFLKLLGRFKLTPFGIYRIALGILVISLLS